MKNISAKKLKHEQYKFPFYNKLEVRPKPKKTKSLEKEDETEQFVFSFFEFGKDIQSEVS